MGKVLSIIVPTYNMENYLNKCLDSLIVSNMDLLEVLVINDGSKDKSSEIAHKYERKYPNVFRVIDKYNGNYGSCINRGLKEASGKYIKVLDADDSFISESLKIYIDTICKQDADLILNDCITVNLNGKIINNWKFRLPDNVLLKFADIYPQMHCVAYKTENLKKINYYQTEGISYTDQEWVFYPMITVSTMFYISVPLYCYLVGRDGQTMAPSIYLTKGFGHEIIITKRMLEFLARKESSLYDYLTRKFLQRIQQQYSEIIVNKGFQQFSELIYLDNYIKENYWEYYDLINKRCILSNYLPFHFIVYWRNHKYKLSKYHPIVYIYIIKNKLRQFVKKYIYSYKYKLKKGV